VIDDNHHAARRFETEKSSLPAPCPSAKPESLFVAVWSEICPLLVEAVLEASEPHSGTAKAFERQRMPITVNREKWTIIRRA
jgi:hypothetical protein